MRISDWSSDVCSSDLVGADRFRRIHRLRAGTEAERRFLSLVDAGKSAGELAAVDEALDEGVGRRIERRAVGAKGERRSRQESRRAAERARKSTRLKSSH